MIEGSKTSSKHIVFPPGPAEIIPYRLALKFISNPLPILLEIANRYGDVSHFKFGPKLHVYLINNANYIEDILVKDNNRFIKSPGLRLAKRVLGNGLITSEGKIHDVQRRLVQQAFNRNRIKTYGKIISEYSSVYINNNWKDGLVLDIHKEMTKLTLAIISKILFGSNTLELSDIDNISNSITIIIEYINKLRIPFLKFIEILPLPSTIKYKRALSDLDKLIYHKINERRQKIKQSQDESEITLDFSEKTTAFQNKDNIDMLSILIASSYNKETDNKENTLYEDGNVVRMDNRQLRDEVMTMFLAGHETTANALTWTIYLLALHPKIESKIVDEIISLTGSDDIDNRLITPDDVSKLKYTEMVLMESMRLYPPSWAIGRQAIENYNLANKYVIPSGSVLIISQYLVHHDSRYFSQPDQFYPERWTPEFRASIPRFSYFPFGGGSRSCIGEPLAWMEGIIVLATIIKKWKITLEENMKHIELRPLVTLRPKYGIRVKLHKR